MKSPVSSIINRMHRRYGDPVNIIYFGYDGILELLFAKLNANFFVVHDSYIYKFSHALPINFYQLDKSLSFPHGTNIDIIVCTHRSHIKNANNIARMLHVPVVLYEQELPTENTSEALKTKLNDSIENIDCITSRYILDEEWNKNSEAICKYGFELYDNNLRTNDFILCGSYKNDDRFINAIQQEHPNIEYFGYGNSFRPYKSCQNIIDHFVQSQVCVIAYGDTQPPILLMMAMSCGCCVVANHTRWTNSIIQNETTGFLFESITELKEIMTRLSRNGTMVNNVAKNGQKMIECEFGQGAFLNQLNEYLYDVTQRTYRL